MIALPATSGFAHAEVRRFRESQPLYRMEYEERHDCDKGDFHDDE